MLKTYVREKEYFLLFAAGYVFYNYCGVNTLGRIIYGTSKR
jgi:mannose/fructose/N-acetylgalactosamine-specific phosphotransferase system component IIC